MVELKDGGSILCSYIHLPKAWPGECCFLIAEHLYIKLPIRDFFVPWVVRPMRELLHELYSQKSHHSKQPETIVIGGGQAGLAVGYHLAQRNLPFQILDANEYIGDAWRNRWDSLRLFSPARYSGLPGMSFPGRGDAFPTKNQVADYLVEYARRFQLPVRNGVRVDRLWKEGERFV